VLDYYLMKISKQSFFISNEKKPRALVAIKDIKDACPYSIWVSSQGIVLGRVLDEGMVAWRYCPEHDKEKNIIGLRFLGDCLLDDDVLFMALAPYVRTGSYLEITSSEGKWRWSFRNEQMFWDPC